MVCACGAPVEVFGAVVVEAEGAWVFEGAWVLAVSGAFCAAGAEVVGVWVCVAAGAVVVEFGDCANAAVAKTRPTAVVMRKRVFIWCSSSCDLQKIAGAGILFLGNLWQRRSSNAL